MSRNLTLTGYKLLRQTPTDQTYRILYSDDPVREYTRTVIVQAIKYARKDKADPVEYVLNELEHIHRLLSYLDNNPDAVFGSD